MIPVKVLFPIHRNTLSNDEWKSLGRCMNILGRYPVSLVIPQSLDVTVILSRYPALLTETFPDEFFRGIEGYNRLMLSEEFYARFADAQYILIYQPDAWVFEDMLGYWVEQGFDYAGAPWVVKPKYSTWYYRIFAAFRSFVLKKPLKSTKLSGKSGNGGLSLRKIESHLQVIRNRKADIEKYLSKSVKSDLYNEDVFWSVENPQFRYPAFEKALEFAWDQHPEICLKQTGGKLPFGCHGWTKTAEVRKFWKSYIN